MNNKIIEFFRWGIYHILDCMSKAWNVLCGFFGIEQQADLGLSWLVWMESRRVEREIQVMESRRLKQQEEAEDKMQLAKTDLDSHGKDI